MEEKIKKFKNFLDIHYKASQIYDEPDAVSVWEDVIDKFNELFE